MAFLIRSTSTTRWCMFVATVLMAHGCNKISDTGDGAPPPQRVRQSTFEPVYRAAKAIQGATTAGVAYAKFGELLQAFSTEIAIAKDHELNEPERHLIALYENAFTHYQTSATLWKLQIEVGDHWGGNIPVTVYFGTNESDWLASTAKAYDIPVSEYTEDSEPPLPPLLPPPPAPSSQNADDNLLKGFPPLPPPAPIKPIKVVPGDSFQYAWQKADAALDQATEMYYGRETK